MNRLIRETRRRAMVACTCCVALACLGCGRDADRAYDRGSTVTLASREEWLDPGEDTPAKFLAFLPLTALNERGELEGRLAVRWEHSADWREWTYHLRPGVRWHDGIPVTAQDIVFSVNFWQRPEVMHYYTGFVESAIALDDSTVRIRYTTSADQSIASYLTYYPQHVLEKLDPAEFYRWDFWTHPIGNGPYRFVSYLPRTMMEFEANPDFYGAKPRVERVVLKFVGDAGLTELLAGTVDAVTWTNPVDIPKLADDPRFRVYYEPESYRGWAIYWQNDHPLFRDPRVRRALTLAIDRRGLLRALNLPDGVPILEGPLTEPQLRRGDLQDPLPYYPDEARRLLEAAGWRDGDGDGMREKDGQAFRFTTLVEGAEEPAVFIQDRLRRIGVRTELRPLDQGSVRDRIRAGEFEAVLAPYDNNPGSLGGLGLGEGPPLGYTNAEVVRLVNDAGATADPHARDRIYGELTAILRRDTPMTFLFPRVNVVFAHRRLRGLRSPWNVDPAWHMEKLWLEEEPEE